MKGTETLRSEHNGIGKMLEVLKLCGIEIREGNFGELETVRNILDFSVNFTDRCHHKKEEGHLFPVLINKGIPNIKGPVRQMLEDHRQGRETLKKIAANLEDFSTEKSIPLAQNVFHYADLLEKHIEKENTILFKMAEEALSDQEQAELNEAFELVEKEEIGEGVHEQYHNMIHEYIHKFGLE